MPRASVIILSHRAELLPDAFGSAHAQTYADTEIIVKYSAQYWPEKLNEAIRASSGEYFTVLCDDDLLQPTFLERTIAEADKAHADLAYTDHEIFGPLPLKWSFANLVWNRETLKTHCLPHFTALNRRDLFEKVGGYDGAMSHTDWDYYWRCMEAGATAVHLPNEYLWKYRAHAGNGSRDFVGDSHLAQLRAKHPEITAMDHGRVKVA